MMRKVLLISKRLVALIGILHFCICSFSQGFIVKEFRQNLNDGSAFHAPMDADGHPCGLIKVRTDNPELQFKGAVVGDVENKMNEYWVYVSQSCRQLKVCHPNFMPLIVPFSDYSIDISSKATYILTLEATKYKKEKAGVTIIVKPENADLYIDDVSVDNLSGNGFYQLYLPKGEHVCKLSKAGYRPNIQIVQTGKASQNVNVELESVMADFEVKCKTTTAEIYVDGELKGNGAWKGEILAGEHKIEARQMNFVSYMQTVSLAEKDSRAITIPELERAKGKMRIETVPPGLPLIVDGRSVGDSPCTIELETGIHYADCKSYGILPCKQTIEINGSEEKCTTVKVEFDDDDYRKAYNGDLDAILDRACWAAVRYEFSEAVFWAFRHPQADDVLMHWSKYGEKTQYAWWKVDWVAILSETGNPEKALEILPAVLEDEEVNVLEDLSMESIGRGFLKKNELEKAVQCFEKAEIHGYEGLGDCYAAKGDKQRAAIYYKKCLNLDYHYDHNEKKRIDKKLMDLGY